MFWSKLRGLWEKAKQGGAILARPRDYFVRVALPSFVAWVAKLGVIAVFLAGYGITVSFHTVMSVAGGNSIANTVAVTPGGVGVNQAANVASLDSVTDAATATAYSLGQQLAITAWNIAFALVIVLWAFGWTGGKVLVEQSYADAKTKVADSRAARKASGPPPSERLRERLGLDRVELGLGDRAAVEQRLGLVDLIRRVSPPPVAATVRTRSSNAAWLAWTSVPGARPSPCPGRSGRRVRRGTAGRPRTRPTRP